MREIDSLDPYKQAFKDSLEARFPKIPESHNVGISPLNPRFYTDKVKGAVGKIKREFAFRSPIERALITATGIGVLAFGVGLISLPFVNYSEPVGLVSGGVVIIAVCEAISVLSQHKTR